MHRLPLLRRFVVFLLAITLVLVAGSAALGAAPAMTMEELNLAIMPEYDAMNVIVNATGSFINDTGGPFQNEIVWTMANGGEVFMVCETENGMSCQPYRLDTSNPDYDQVIWKPSRAIRPGEKFPVMFEYTMNKITAPGARKFNVLFVPAFSVKTLTVGFKQPKDSSNLVLNPASSQTYQDSEGFTEYYYNYSQLKPFEKRSFDVSYTRNQTKPSKEPPTGEGASGGGNTNDRLMAVLLAVVGVLLGAVLFYAMRSNNRRSPSPKRRGPNGTRPKEVQHQVAAAREPKPTGTKGTPSAKGRDERKRIRKLLLDGKIGEETYRELIRDLEDEE